jgi:hypothetical protein
VTEQQQPTERESRHLAHVAEAREAQNADAQQEAADRNQLRRPHGKTCTCSKCREVDLS